MLAAAFGLVPARRYNSLVKQLDDVRNSAQGWKTKAGEAMAQVKSVEGEVKRHQRLVKEARIAAEKAHHQLGDAGKLQEQLVDTERELMLAREHLMAIEVKLDILEGAANVLDARTRTAVHRQSAGTGAAV
jgi:predicted  nucleic acid-binding Zn-ribbon protein